MVADRRLILLSVVQRKRPNFQKRFLFSRVWLIWQSQLRGIFVQIHHTKTTDNSNRYCSGMDKTRQRQWAELSSPVVRHVGQGPVECFSRSSSFLPYPSLWFTGEVVLHKTPRNGCFVEYCQKMAHGVRSFRKSRIARKQIDRSLSNQYKRCILSQSKWLRENLDRLQQQSPVTGRLCWPSLLESAWQDGSSQSAHPRTRILES